MASLSLRAGAQILGLSALWCNLLLGVPQAAADEHHPAITRSTTKASSRPNFVFIITDDQDSRLGSLDYMPLLKKYLSEQGTTFQSHYCTIALCCPSRVSLLTGKAAHNTNVTDVTLPYGGYTQFVNNGLNSEYLPVWLQDAGYSTYYTGKLMNGFTTANHLSPAPQGWNGTDLLLDPQTYWYYNSSMARNSEAYRYITGNYSTDVVADDALEYIDKAASHDTPFFLGVAPIGPHTEMTPATGRTFLLPTPAKRHDGLFPDLTVPKTPSFNKLKKNGPSYYPTLPALNSSEIAYMDTFYQKRIEALQAIDELVEKVVQRLEKYPDVLENTYIIYTSDNGFHMGQHRLPPGKTCNIEEDINVPFVVRGPGVKKGAIYHHPTTHTDIVPTLFSLADIPLHDDFDGEPIPVTEEMQRDLDQDKSEHINVEFWGENLKEGSIPEWAAGVLTNNTYKHVRVLSTSYDLSYTVWCTNDHELYDLSTDPFQTHNLYRSFSSSPTTTATTNTTASAKVAGYAQKRLQARLDALLLTLKGCKGSVCVRPWRKLHPAGDVHNLADAMAPKFDAFYEEQQRKVSFEACMLGYLPEYEDALEPVVYGGNASEEVKRAVEEVVKQ